MHKVIGVEYHTVSHTEPLSLLLLPLPLVKLGEEELDLRGGRGVAVGAVAGVAGVRQSELAADGGGVAVSGGEHLQQVHQVQQLAVYYVSQHQSQS